MKSTVVWYVNHFLIICLPLSPGVLVQQFYLFIILLLVSFLCHISHHWFVISFFMSDFVLIAGILLSRPFWIKKFIRSLGKKGVSSWTGQQSDISLWAQIILFVYTCKTYCTQWCLLLIIMIRGKVKHPAVGRKYSNGQHFNHEREPLEVLKVDKWQDLNEFVEDQTVVGELQKSTYSKWFKEEKLSAPIAESKF